MGCGATGGPAGGIGGTDVEGPCAGSAGGSEELLVGGVGRGPAGA